jgi:hypothetical protein
MLAKRKTLVCHVFVSTILLFSLRCVLLAEKATPPKVKPATTTPTTTSAPASTTTTSTGAASPRQTKETPKETVAAG